MLVIYPGKEFEIFFTTETDAEIFSEVPFKLMTDIFDQGRFQRCLKFFIIIIVEVDSIFCKSYGANCSKEKITIKFFAATISLNHFIDKLR